MGETIEIKNQQKKIVRFNVGEKEFIEIGITVVEYTNKEIRILYTTGDDDTIHRHTSIGNHHVVKRYLKQQHPSTPIKELIEIPKEEHIQKLLESMFDGYSFESAKRKAAEEMKQINPLFKWD